MITRKEIRSLLPEELLTLRRAMIEFQNMEETNPDGYIYIAGFHGMPKNLCDHDKKFLAWHRMYIWYFEDKLRKIDSNISLPYWNWTLQNHFNDPLAPAHNDTEYVDSDGQAQPNSLYSGPIYQLPSKTHRNPAFTNDKMQSAIKKLALAFKSQYFVDFNNFIFYPHGDIHLYFGPSSQMYNSRYAAYDPIFWSHHAEVDRQWAVWQELHPGAVVPNKDDDLQGFHPKKVNDVLDYRNDLRYQYDDLSLDVEKFKNVHDYLHGRIFLKIEGVAMIVDSYSVDVYLINKQNKERIYGGFFGVFGMEHSMPTNGHMQHLMRSNQYIDVTDALKGIKADKSDVLIKLQAVDMNGNVINENMLDIGSITFQQPDT